jgi:hypothetical protein
MEENDYFTKFFNERFSRLDDKLDGIISSNMILSQNVNKLQEVVSDELIHGPRCFQVEYLKLLLDEHDKRVELKRQRKVLWKGFATYTAWLVGIIGGIIGLIIGLKQILIIFFILGSIFGFV